MPLSLLTDIKAVGLSNRTTNALVRNNINTIQDLCIWVDALSENDRASLRGIGQAGIEEIKEFLARAKDITDGSVEGPNCIGNYWREIQQDDRNFNILVEYYNSGYKTTFQDLGDKYKLSRARVQQIVSIGTSRLQDAFDGGIFGSELVDALDEYANNRTEVHMMDLNDGVFTGTGVAYLVSAFDGSNYKVYSSDDLNGEWFIKAEDKLGKVLGVLIDELKHSSEPLLLSAVRKFYSISDSLIMSIKGVIEKDGYITHEKNKKATGTDRYQVVTRYLDSVNRPASISEIARNTILSEGQVRSALCDKGAYVNVGKAVYDLIDRDYGDLSAEELAINILTAEDRALKINAVLKYIQRYKTISEQSFYFVLLDTPGLKRHDDYLLLADWTLDKIEKKARPSYYIKLEDAVLEILNSSDELFDYEKVSDRLKKYDGKVSTNQSSIKATLIRLAEKGLIKRVGGANTGCYMRKNDAAAADLVTGASNLQAKIALGAFVDSNIGKRIQIRYKTKRLNSDKRWRVISVRGHDARYIYTNDLNNYGYKVKYLKDRVVEYREFKPDWYYDVCYCVEKLDDVFSLEEAYRFEEELSRRHPLNNNVHAKIRQQIQLMIKNGLISRLVPGFYCKNKSFKKQKEIITEPKDSVVSIIDRLIAGKEYKNNELVEIFKVSSQGGMRKSNKTNSLVLIAKHRPDNPYDDKWNGDQFEYTGMGLYGDQSISYMQNKTLAESEVNGVTVYLFESFKDDSYTYRGIVKLADAPYFEMQKDELGNEREVVKFPLKLVEEN